MTTELRPDSAELIQKGRDFLVSTYRQRERILDHGKGSRVWDSEGREYVDFAAGIAVSALGHGDPDILAALHEQAGKLWHTSNAFYSEPPLRLAEELVAASGFAKRVFFCNSGSEAIEASIKLVRRWADTQGRPPERRVILSFSGSFHGRTLAAVTATAQPKYQQGFEPLPGGFLHCAFNDLDALDAAFDDSVAAVIVEPIQGEGGVLPVAEGFLAALRERCDRHGALLVFDEIQCGVGRTGKLWAHQWDGVQPDVMTVAKGLGCGFPIGSMLVGDKAADTLQFGSHGSTFGGNPLAAAVARVALRKLSAADLLSHVAKQGLHLQLGLERIGNAHGVFGEVRGRGLMLGAVLTPAYAGRAPEILDFAAGEGLLLLQAGADVLRFVPALNIPVDDIDDGLDRLEKALKRLTA